MILLKTACFSLWLAMMLVLGLAKLKHEPSSTVSLYLDDPGEAELQIFKAMGRLSAGERLSLEISAHNPNRSELYFIASRITRKYPSIFVKVLGATEN